MVCFLSGPTETILMGFPILFPRIRCRRWILRGILPPCSSGWDLLSNPLVQCIRGYIFGFDWEREVFNVPFFGFVVRTHFNGGKPERTSPFIIINWVTPFTNSIFECYEINPTSVLLFPWLLQIRAHTSHGFTNFVKQFVGNGPLPTRVV